MATELKRILVTGANKGIGLAIVRSLLHDRSDTLVFLGSRDLGRGAAARDAVIEGNAALADRCEVVELDVSEGSVSAVASKIGKPLYAVVNNAGVWGTPAVTFQTNVFGVQRVTDAVLPLLAPTASGEPPRIVMISSGVAPTFVHKCSEERRGVLTKAASSVDSVMADAQACLEALEEGPRDAGAALEALGYPKSHDGQAIYGASKALLNQYTVTLAAQLKAAGSPVVVNACSPGFILTDMTRPFLADTSQAAPPAAATKVVNRLLFDDADALGSGHYFGSDAKRSPLDRYRSPGDPEYTGE